MKAKRYLITLFQILLLIIVAVALFLGYKALVDPVNVYVFNQEIPSGVKITSSMVKVVQVPRATLSTANYVTSGEELENKATTGKVFEGQYVLKQNIIDEKKVSPFTDSSLTKNLRKVAIRASFETAAGGTLQKGDVVDLLISKKRNDSDEYETKTFLKDVLVYNVIDGDGNTYVYDEVTYADTNDNQVTSDDENAYSTVLDTVILAVSPADAELIINNAKSGSISIITQFEEN